MPSPLLKQLFEDLDQSALRVARPTRFIFLCGGRTDKLKPLAPVSLRQYLLYERGLAKRVNASLVLAESANELYRDTNYRDLISFEEDIAQISTSVMVITESEGSLAELGAFTANDKIRQHVAIISQTAYSHAESFVRYGPIERIKKDDKERVAFFPWATNKQRQVVKNSAATHVKDIATFINKVVAKTPVESAYSTLSPRLLACANIVWLLHQCTAMSLTEIRDYYHYTFDADLTQSDAQNLLFCMKIAGWVNQYEYINKEYWYSTQETDPFVKYRYKNNVLDTVTIGRKLAVAKEVGADLRVHKHVIKHVLASKVKIDAAA